MLSTYRPSAKTLVLAIILTCQLMIVLDVSIVITALPEIHTDLDFSATNLSWIQNAYTLTFGGLLLLGARAGDLLGRRRMFVAGIALFSAASLAAGLAQSEAWLLAARAVQGIGAAVAAPATLALLTTTFAPGIERVRAIAAYSAVSAAAGSLGLVIGGMLTDWVSWRWGMFLNVPIGAAVVLLAPRVLPGSERVHGHFDLKGATTSVAGMTALVFGFVHAATAGFGDTVSLVSFAAAAVLIGGFLNVERRAEQPITPLRLFTSRTRSGALVARALTVSGMLSMFFFITQYLQGVRGYSPLEAGVAFLPLTLVIFAMSRVMPRLTGRFGDTSLLVGGLTVATSGMVWLTQLDATSAFWPHLAVPLLLLGLGMGAAFTPLTSLGVAGVEDDDAGAASGLVNVAHQLGGSLGLAVLVTVFAGAGGDDAPDAVAFTHAITTALTGGVVCLALALIVAIGVVARPALRFGRAPEVA